MTSSPHPPLHPSLEPLAALLGTWTGRGRGEYPTIEPFEYTETVGFTHVGKPFLAYVQRTRWLLPDGSLGEPLHAESGYWRCPAPGAVEIVLAHPTGIVEVYEGTIAVAVAEVAVDVSATIARTASAKQVSATERTFHLTGDSLTYRMSMAAVGERLQHHLAAELARDDPGTA